MERRENVIKFYRYILVILIIAMTLPLLLTACINEIKITSKENNLSISEAQSLIIKYYGNLGREIEPEKINIYKIMPYKSGYLVLSYYSGEGAQLCLFEVEKDTLEHFELLKMSTGEIAISSGLSINLINDNKSTIVFGNLNKTLWNPLKNEKMQSDFEKIIVTFNNGSKYSEIVKNDNGYLIIVDNELHVTDWTCYNSKKEIVTDYKKYLEWGYKIEKTLFANIER